MIITFSGGRQGKLPTAAFEMFDFSTRQWQKLPDIPSKRVFAMYTTDGKHIFSIGGLRHPASEGFSDTCEVFDIDKGKLYLLHMHLQLSIV